MQSAPITLPEKPAQLKTPQYKKRDRPLKTNVQQTLKHDTIDIKKVKLQPPKVVNNLLDASVSPTSPLKSSALLSHHASHTTHQVGKHARHVFEDAMTRIKKRRVDLSFNTHLCTHFTKCKEGCCQTCKCVKCLRCQPSGKRASALRPK
jgi:hypothetical protein